MQASGANARRRCCKLGRACAGARVAFFWRRALIALRRVGLPSDPRRAAGAEARRRSRRHPARHVPARECHRSSPRLACTRAEGRRCSRRTYFRETPLSPSLGAYHQRRATGWLAATLDGARASLAPPHAHGRPSGRPAASCQSGPMPTGWRRCARALPGAPFLLFGAEREAAEEKKTRSHERRSGAPARAAAPPRAPGGPPRAPGASRRRCAGPRPRRRGARQPVGGRAAAPPSARARICVPARRTRSQTNGFVADSFSPSFSAVCPPHPQLGARAQCSGGLARTPEAPLGAL